MLGELEDRQETKILVEPQENCDLFSISISISKKFSVSFQMTSINNSGLIDIYFWEE